jgi:hypothetical protein
MDINTLYRQIDDLQLIIDKFYDTHPGYIANTDWDAWIKSFRLKNNFITRSWIKMYEFLTMLNWKKDITALFNAEMPGGFLLATDYYTKFNKLKLDWRLNSLMPFEPTVDYLEDKYNLKDRFPNNVLFGYHNIGNRRLYLDGDITNRTVRKLISKMTPKVNLYTSDGGTECSDHGNKEVAHMKLKYGEFALGLSICDVGAVMLIKLYGIRTNSMISLIISTAKCFQSWKLWKPQGSNPVNEEFYFIGIGYRPVPAIINLIDSADPFPDELIYRPEQSEYDELDAKLIPILQNRIDYISKYVQGDNLYVPAGHLDIKLDNSITPL